MYVFNQKLGIQTFDDCAEKCPTIEGNGFKKGQMHIPCITSFDMNAQLLAWVQGKTGGQDKGEKNFVWIGHKTAPGSNNGKWVEDDCEKMQQNQFKGDFVCRNGCSFEGDTKKPICRGSDWESCDGNPFDSAVGCAILVNARTNVGAASLNVPKNPGSYDELHCNWIKSDRDCEMTGENPISNKPEPVDCICQKIM